MFQLLIVDAEEDLLWALSKNLCKDRPDVRVKTASNKKEALAIMRSDRIDLLVADLRSSAEFDGFELILAAKDLLPRARVLAMTAFSTDGAAFTPSMGIARFINKPFDIQVLQDVVLEVEAQRESAQGVLSELALADILALLCLSKRTLRLHLNHPNRRGRIEVVQGEILHAEFDGRVGDEAVYTLMGLRQGNIFMQGDFVPAPPSVKRRWQELLNQARQWLDTHGAVEEEPVVEIPVEGWEEEPADVPAAEGESNPLGFSAEEFRELAMDEIDLMRHREGQREDSLPRPPMLRPTSSMGMMPGHGPRRSEISDPSQHTLEGVGALLGDYRAEIEGLRLGLVINASDGTVLASVAADGERLEAEVSAAYFSEVIRIALKLSHALGEDVGLRSVQLSADDYHILVRMLPDSVIAQMLIMEADANLGIGAYVMRRMEGRLFATLLGGEV